MAAFDRCEELWRKESECTPQQTAITWQMDATVSLDSLFVEEEEEEEGKDKEEEEKEEEKEVSIRTHAFPGDVQIRIQEFGYHPHNAGESL